jgi:tetratricopeptide (TPR) repeat protein
MTGHTRPLGAIVPDRRHPSYGCRLHLVCCAVVLMASACDRSDVPGVASRSTAGGGLREVSLPALGAADAAVQAQVQARFDEMRAITERASATDAERAQAYGAFGMVLHAGGFHDAAAPAYVNARSLAPADHRWPYLLALLHRSRGDTSEAIAAYRDTLALRPGDVPALVGLAQLHLDRGEPEQAQPLFERARQADPDTVAALVGLGQVALSRREFESAVSWFSQALTRDPQADSIHAPLAAAYRGLGQLQEAERHMAQWRNTEIPLRDPLLQELNQALDSGLAFESRGVRALEQRDFAAAATFFERGVALTPADTPLGRSLRHKLGTALYMKGDAAAALKWFMEALREAPESGQDEAAANAHYSIGVLMATAGRSSDAIRHLSAAVRYSPSHLEALQALGDALRRAGRDEEALGHYAALVKMNPRATDARFGYGMALVRLGRFREARDWFEEAMSLIPDRREFPLALARLLAAAPDAPVRDAARARSLVDALASNQRTTDVGETLAMVLAEEGDFEQAASVQRAVMDASRRAGFTENAARMAPYIRLYERGRPARAPWPADDPVFSPGPPVDPAVRATLPA